MPDSAPNPRDVIARRLALVDGPDGWESEFADRTIKDLADAGLAVVPSDLLERVRAYIDGTTLRTPAARDALLLALAGTAEAVPVQRPGTWATIAAGLDSYHAVNLLEALKVIPDTGDWHGSLRIASQAALNRERAALRPNQTANWMRERVVAEDTVRLRAALTTLMEFGKRLMDSEVMEERAIGCCICESARVIEPDPA